MNSSEETEDGVCTSYNTHHEHQTKADSVMKPWRPDPPGPTMKRNSYESILYNDGPSDKNTPAESERRPDSPGPTCVSMKSDWSMFEPIDFENGEQIQPKPERPDSPGPTCVSMKSDWSMFEPIDFENGEQIQLKLERPDSPGPSPVSRRSTRFRSEPIEFRVDWSRLKPRPHRKRAEVISERRPSLNNQTSMDSIFTLLEENIITFVKNELRALMNVLDAERFGKLNEDEGDDLLREEEEGAQTRRDKEALQKIALSFLRRMKQETLADSLQSKMNAVICQRQLKSRLKRNFQYLFEGVPKAGNPTLINQIYTELSITEGDNRELNDQHEVRQVEAVLQRPASSEKIIRCEDLFGLSPERAAPVRTVVTKGVAGIGKTVLTQKFILDWAEDKANRNIQFIFPFKFRELNLLKKRKFSLVELLHHVFTATKEAGIRRFNEFNVVFILDGLDECVLPLDFHNNELITDVAEPASIEVLLTNLIRGNLLPSAHVWITTRPAAANQIPPECIDMVTEVKGFNDPQKEEYFRKKFRDEAQASRVISHIKTSRNLHNLCYIPVFCWINAAVLDDLLKNREMGELPKTLTEMYIHFLVVQTKKGNVKYHIDASADSVWNTTSKKTILTLGKLAFEQLEKGNLIFYEADLQECGIDIQAASVYSGLFTEILKEGPSQDKVFSFVHLSIQEFLAALHVSLTFMNQGVDLLRKKQFAPIQPLPMHRSCFKLFYKSAVDRALQSPNGHLDLFVRFLLGLSLESNQTLLRGLLRKTASTAQDTVLYIKKKIQDNPSPPEKSINLFHCLNELNDQSLVEEMQQYLRCGSHSKDKLSPAQCSALAFILLSSQKDLDEIDLRQFSTSEAGLLRLLPLVKAFKTSVLSSCNLSWRSCEALTPVLSSMNSPLRKLDLSNNELHDKGVEFLSAGLKSPHCRLEILILSGCLVTEKGCTFLANALNSNPSSLKELDLSFNHPGDSGVKLLRAGMDDQRWKLQTLKIDHCGKCRLKPSPLRYFVELTLDPITANKNLLLSDDNRGVMLVREKLLHLDHPDKFDIWKQLLCDQGLTGRCYWEVKWNGRVNIGVTYSGIKRSGDGDDCCIGWNEKSWSLVCSPQSYTAWHNNTATEITKPQVSCSNRVAVYLDWPAGILSFFCLPSVVSSARPIHLHTFQSTFTEPLYPAFGFGRMLELVNDSKLSPASVYLTPAEE